LLFIFNLNKVEYTDRLNVSHVSLFGKSRGQKRRRLEKAFVSDRTISFVTLLQKKPRGLAVWILRQLSFVQGHEGARSSTPKALGDKRRVRTAGLGCLEPIFKNKRKSIFPYIFV
jgi:hypothetical protein